MGGFIVFETGFWMQGYIGTSIQYIQYFGDIDVRNNDDGEAGRTPAKDVR